MTYSCAYIDNGSDGNVFPCGLWKSSSNSGKDCVNGDGDEVDCNQALDCCKTICGKDYSKLQPDDTCTDNN